MSIPRSRTELTKVLNLNEFELAILVNKRVQELMRGAKPLIAVATEKINYIETAINELLSNKIKMEVIK